MLFRHRFLVVLSVLLLPLATLHAGPLETDPFTLDPGFNAGAIRLDRFGGNNSTHRSSVGHRVARLADGSYVVAALVDAFGAETGTITGIKNIGLLHVDANGQKIAWPAVDSAYTDSSHNYIVIPNQLDARYTAISDVQFYNARIYVMADHAEDNGRTDVHVLAFGLDGSYQGVVATTSGEVESGVGMVFANISRTLSYMMLVTSREFQSNGFIEIRLARYKINDLTLTVSLDTSFGNSGYQLRVVTDCYTPGTGVAIGCETSPNAITAINRNDAGETVATPYIFVTGRYWQDAGDGSPAKWRSFVMKTDIEGHWQFPYGTPNAAGGNDGIVKYDLPDTPEYNVSRAVAVRHEQGDGLVTFVLHGIDRSCGTGFNIARIDGTGLNVAAASSTPFGGSDAYPCTSEARVFTDATSMVLQGDRLAVVGSTADYFLGMFPEKFAWLTIFDATRGLMTEYQPLRTYIGEDIAHGALNDIVAAGEGRFVAVGGATDSARNQRDLATVAGLRSDRIFAGSFGSDRFDD